ncbi:MAG: histidinol-phosphatase HisJ [Candidatus Lokiarchaeota archaeon]|nr:histidinol-phosphatase HisJ [Candidatus Lokiarchaeota archaeon]
MAYGDWHTHNQGCKHAVGKIEEYVKIAIEFKLKTIGVSDHFPYEFLNDIERIPYEEYAIALPEIEKYLTTSEELKEKYKQDITVRIGFEIDYFKNQESALNTHLNPIKKRLDFILGSIHILNFFNGRGAWGFDDSRFRKEYEYYGVDAVYLFYYQSIQKMVNSDKFDFDIISHFDLPKKFNDIPTDKEKVYEEMMRTLEQIKKKGVAMEINTGGLRKDCKEQYPSVQIIKEMFFLDIPVLLGSDAHRPEEIAWKFDKMIEILKRIGYSELAHYHNRKRTFIEI